MLLAWVELRKFLLLIWVAVLTACGGGGGGGVPDSYSGNPEQCSVKQSKDILRTYMRSDYFWNAEVKSLLDSDIPYVQAGSNVEAYFNALLWTPARSGKDRYSFMYTAADYSAAVNAEATGFGVYWSWASSGASKVARALYVEPGSPGEVAGIARGDTLVQVNGAPFIYGSVSQAQIDALYPPKAGTVTDFTLKSVSGATKTLRLSSKLVEESPVLLSKTLVAADGKKVGYLVFNTFMAQKGLAQLQRAFRQFKADGISDLVLDLRYNGGGSLEIARALAGMIGGEAVRDKTFYLLIHNANRTANNQAMTFNVDADPSANLGLSRLFVLTGSGSASASEAVIYGLKAFIPVIQIGEQTYGKPVGMYATEMCGNYYFAINFEGVNAKNEGAYYNGIAPTCAVADDLNHVFGDNNEALLASALAYREKGVCPATVAKGAAQSVADKMEPLRDNPLRNNLLISR